MVYTDYRDLYNSVRWQNDMVLTESAKLRDQYSTDNQRVVYLNEDVQWWTSLNFILWWIYYLAFLAVTYFTFYGKARGYSTRTKILIVCAFLLYPAVILTLEKWVYDLFQFIYALIVGKAYVKTTDATPPFSILDAMPPGHH
jgi:hypothetical protein